MISTVKPRRHLSFSSTTTKDLTSLIFRFACQVDLRANSPFRKDANIISVCFFKIQISFLRFDTFKAKSCQILFYHHSSKIDLHRFLFHPFKCGCAKKADDGCDASTVKDVAFEVFSCSTEGILYTRATAPWGLCNVLKIPGGIVRSVINKAII